MKETDPGMSYCGLLCKSCPIFMAAREADPDRRKRMHKEIAGICNSEYGMSLTPDDITECDGCRMESGRLFTSCTQCRIRKCARERKYESCAQCPQYACEDLAGLHRTDPAARIRLDGIRLPLKE